MGRRAPSITLVGGAAAFPSVAGLIATALGVTALAGWTLGTPSLTGVGICLLGAALPLLAREPVGGGRRVAACVLAGAATLLGICMLADYAIGARLGVDLLALPDALRAAVGDVPRRPTFASGAALVSIGAALLVLDAGRRGRPVTWLAGTVLAVTLWALVGDLLGGTAVGGTGGSTAPLPVFTPMSIPSALAFCALALGTLAARPDRGPIALCRGVDAGAFMARRALAPVVVVPVVLAWLRLQGERAGLYPETIGVSLVAASTVVALVVVVLWNAAALRRLDAARRRAADALQEARTELELALSAGAIATWTFHPADDPAGDRVFGEARLAALFAVPAEALREGTPLETLETRIHPDDRARVSAAMAGAIERRAAYEEEYRIARPDGSLRWVVARGVCEPDQRTGRLRFPGTVVDVTERRRVEDAQRLLAAAGLLLSATLDPDRAGAAVADIVVPTLADWCVVDVTDADGDPRPVGVAAASATQHTALREWMEHEPDRAACLGTVAARMLDVEGPALIPDASGGARHAALLAKLHAGSALVLPLVARDRRFGTVLVAGNATSRRFDDRDLALGVDLARRAALAIDNALLYRASCDAIEMRDQVLRVVAHDLQNPIASIAMNVQLIERSPGREGEIHRVRTARIRAAVSRADRLIHDLLDVARLEAGSLQLSLHPGALRPLLLEAVELNRTLSEGAGHAIELSVPEDLEPVLMDRDRLLQVLGNLLGNAIKFTPAGGRIRVSAVAVAGGVRVEVTDSGPGIPPEHLSDLFRPFWQARPGAGAGLGLAIAKGIVEAHGGRIGAEHAPDGGGRFWFTIPAAARVPAAADVDAGGDGPAAERDASRLLVGRR